MISLALTGGIGMGKTTTARLFADEGVAVWDADAAVHRLYAPGGAGVAPVLARFPGVVTQGGGIDRAALSKRIVDDPPALAALEGIVHPLVAIDRTAFIAHAKADGADITLSDIPLLFETGQERDFDAVILVSAPESVRRERVLARPGMTAAKLEAIMARQLPDDEKRTRADYVITTDAGIADARDQVRKTLAAIREKFSGGL